MTFAGVSFTTPLYLAAHLWAVLAGPREPLPPWAINK